MDEWMEGTLIEQDSEHANVENVMRDLKKMLDLDSCEQVQKSGIGPSSVETSQKNLQETNTSATAVSKEKEKEASAQITMEEKPKTFRDQAQQQISPTQTNVAESSILKTPLNEEKGKKREAETTTPITKPSEQPSNKRQRLNSLLEEEFVEELDSQQVLTISETSTHSQGKESRRQQSAEVSSFRPPMKEAWFNTLKKQS